ncbi:GNAT family N-acetyltransferase [Actimicrobium antarcticum]|uniref:L-ornithine N(alpha)-acyltransferase n=1 Tax=Actimicrobium antarcticum TaxID=1051899 RepID=A0ABP7TIP0_9BURK
MVMESNSCSTGQRLWTGAQESLAEPVRQGAWKFEVRWAECEADVQAAQRLRYRVFVQEMGARLVPSLASDHGLDADRFDPYCDHLLVRAVSEENGNHGPLIGTYRVMPPHAARRAGGFYTDTEFDLSPLAQLRINAVELGRSCVDPGWRAGGVIMAMWGALGQYMLSHRLDTMIGCASVGLCDGGRNAADLWRRLRSDHLVAPQWQVAPRTPLPLSLSHDDGLVQDAADSATAINIPPLIKGYLRCGARLLGPPALDLAFNTADLPMMLRFDDLAPRYRKHFLGN